MGNSESDQNDLENFANNLGNGIIDTANTIADGGTTVINEGTNIINDATTTITDAIIIPIVSEIDPSQKEIIREHTRKIIRDTPITRPPRINKKFDIKRDIKALPFPKKVPVERSGKREETEEPTPAPIPAAKPKYIDL